MNAKTKHSLLLSCATIVREIIDDSMSQMIADEERWRQLVDDPKVEIGKQVIADYQHQEHRTQTEINALCRVHLGLTDLIDALKKTMVVLALVLPLSAAWADSNKDRAFNWDAYHQQRDSCTQLDRLRAECGRDTRACDQLTDRQLQRDCTPWRR